MSNYMSKFDYGVELKLFIKTKGYAILSSMGEADKQAEKYFDEWIDNQNQIVGINILGTHYAYKMSEVYKSVNYEQYMVDFNQFASMWFEDNYRRIGYGNGQGGLYVKSEHYETIVELLKKEGK